MNVKLHEMERELKGRLESSATSDGTVERLQERVDKLESAVSHMSAFIADHFRLTEYYAEQALRTAEEINNEDGLLDW